jgi:hypothetical protein
MTGDAFVLRAAEMLFSSAEAGDAGRFSNRDRRRDGVVARHTSPSPLIALLGLPATTEVDLFNDTTAGSYWERSNRFDMALDLTAGRRDLAGLGDVIIAGSRICLRSMSRSNLWGRGMEW